MRYIKSVAWICSLVFTMSFTHDIAMAKFNIYEQDGQIKLFVSIDAEDLSNEIGAQKNQFEIAQVDSFLNNNFLVYMDNNLVRIRTDNLKSKLDHIQINAVLEKAPLHCRTIRLVNTCLIRKEGHSNIIQLDLNSMSHDFRMHKDRTTISVEY